MVVYGISSRLSSGLGYSGENQLRQDGEDRAAGVHDRASAGGREEYPTICSPPLVCRGADGLAVSTVAQRKRLRRWQTARPSAPPAIIEVNPSVQEFLQIRGAR